MANYADIFNVICLYSYSLRGSTVLQTPPRVTASSCVHFLHQ